MTWPLNGSKAGGDLVLIPTSLLIMQTWCFYMTEAEKSVSKQGQVQPCCHSKARSPRRGLENGLVPNCILLRFPFFFLTRREHLSEEDVVKNKV